MNRLVIVKIVLAIVGIGIFAYGARVDDRTIRWVGLGFVVLSFVLRFVRNKPPEG